MCAKGGSIDTSSSPGPGSRLRLGELGVGDSSGPNTQALEGQADMEWVLLPADSEGFICADSHMGVNDCDAIRSLALKLASFIRKDL